MQPSDVQDTDSTKLAELWAAVSDADLLAAAFPRHGHLSHQAAAVVFCEFFRRGLAVPEEPEAGDAGAPIPTVSSVGRWAFALYLLSFTIWGTVLGLLLGARLTVGWGSFVGWLLLLIIPPGWLTIGYMANRFSGFRPDTHGYTRCGQCGYILRGLTTPRCPECGTRI